MTEIRIGIIIAIKLLKEHTGKVPDLRKAGRILWREFGEIRSEIDIFKEVLISLSSKPFDVVSQKSEMSF
jgi:hypothetical protein